MANDRQHILEIHRCCTRIIEESRTINNLSGKCVIQFDSNWRKC